MLSLPRLLALVAVLVGVIALLVYRAGGAGERLKNVVEQSEAAVDSALANKAGAQGVAEATNDHAERFARLQQELADARRRLSQFTAAPAPGTVGPHAVVDPAYAGQFLCELERVRGDAPSAECRPAAPGDH